ncbi:ABC transporter ATP-binding protein [Acuticoccus sp. 2012]|uniref:ABC transporter ATP-binding protein n=1 Tax=Acuticoccus mangrovi TaxID=2796142 RepID=A0A934IVG3_9HYPH|nr:ABC transporter ATP-binding protein [Acuticoccus mangrovi]
MAEGEFVSILGPSGCGKTTTLRCVAGLEIPTGGRILFGDTEVTALPPERRSIGMVFQNYALFPHLTVRRNIAFGLEMRGVRGAKAARRVADVMEMVQLPGMAHRYPRQLSGGQQQRVALARALVVEPSVLLLDEPLANLDAKLRDEMRFFIRSLQKRVGITTLYVTHDQAEAMTMSDRIVVMFDGTIHQIGTPEEIYHRPADRQVAEFIGSSNLIAGRVAEVREGYVTLETAVGMIVCRAGHRPAAGEQAMALIRPEAAELSREANAGSFAGRIVACHFLGNLIDYDIVLGDDTTHRVQTLGETLYAVGDEIAVSVPEEKAWLLSK